MCMVHRASANIAVARGAAVHCDSGGTAPLKALRKPAEPKTSHCQLAVRPAASSRGPRGLCRYYSLFTLGMLVMFECTTVFQRMRHLNELRSLQTPKQSLQACPQRACLLGVLVFQ